MSRPILATERAALILQLVPYLIGTGEVSIDEAAAEFDVDPEQMREMVAKLTVIGLPGEGGFWPLHNDLFDIDWDLLDQHDRVVLTNSVGLEQSAKLTAREAAALLAGLQLARSLPGVGDTETLTALLGKLARGASTTPAEVIVAPGPVDDVRIAVAAALRRGVAVSFTYRAPDAAPTERTVDPFRVHIADGEWYLQGWCHLREANRTFHLDRVSDLALTDRPIAHVDESPTPLFARGENDVDARIRFPVSATALVGDYRDSASLSTRAGLTVATLRVADPSTLKRLAARGGGQIEVLEPREARAAAAGWARAALAQYPADPR